MIPAILLAAGESTRMGQTNKLLLPLDNSTLIKEVVKCYCSIGFTEVLVVVGHEWDKITLELRGLPITLVYNENYRSGMTSSIRKGLQHSIVDTGFLLATTDTPGINPSHLRDLLNTYGENYHDQLIIRSYDGNSISHPSIFASYYKALLEDCIEPDGCKSVILKYQEHQQLVKTSRSGLIDIDTKPEFDAWMLKSKD